MGFTDPNSNPVVSSRNTALEQALDEDNLLSNPNSSLNAFIESERVKYRGDTMNQYQSSTVFNELTAQMAAAQLASGDHIKAVKAINDGAVVDALPSVTGRDKMQYSAGVNPTDPEPFNVVEDNIYPNVKRKKVSHACLDPDGISAVWAIKGKSVTGYSYDQNPSGVESDPFIMTNPDGLSFGGSSSYLLVFGDLTMNWPSRAEANCGDRAATNANHNTVLLNQEYLDIGDVSSTNQQPSKDVLDALKSDVSLGDNTKVPNFHLQVTTPNNPGNLQASPLYTP